MNMMGSRMVTVNPFQESRIQLHVVAELDHAVELAVEVDGPLVTLGGALCLACPMGPGGPMVVKVKDLVARADGSRTVLFSGRLPAGEWEIEASVTGAAKDGERFGAIASKRVVVGSALPDRFLLASRPDETLLQNFGPGTSRASAAREAAIYMETTYGGVTSIHRVDRTLIEADGTAAFLGLRAGRTYLVEPGGFKVTIGR